MPLRDRNSFPEIRTSNDIEVLRLVTVRFRTTELQSTRRSSPFQHNPHELIYLLLRARCLRPLFFTPKIKDVTIKILILKGETTVSPFKVSQETVSPVV